MKVFLIFLTTGIILFSSCRKHEPVTYSPYQPNDSSGMPPLFPDARLQIMSDYEKDKNASLHGHLLAQTLVGMDPSPFIFGYFDLITKAIDGYMDQEFVQIIDEMDEKLDGLLKQDSILMTDVEELSNLMNYNTNEILNQINNIEATKCIATIMSAMNGGNQMGLRWFSQAGANYVNNVPGYDSTYMANHISPAAQQFYDYYYHDVSLESVPNSFTKLTNMMSAPAVGDSGSLMTFARLLIGQFGTKSEHSANSIMNTYMFLEYYYLALANYQFQAATVWMNVLKAKSSDTLEATTWWNTTAMPGILNGAQAFLNATDYLLINLAEYRNQTRWANDMQYSGLWMAPNSDLINVLSRAQFQVKLMTLGLNASAPVIYGTIITPRNYCSTPPGVQVAGGTYNLPLTHNTMPARMPFPAWNGSTCTADNQWTFYNYGFGSNMNCQPWNVNILPTWPHSGAGSGYGTITPLWFNPANPEQTSVVKTQTCTVQFAYFCLSWQWGIMLTDYLNANTCQTSNNLYVYGMSGYGGSHACGLCGDADGTPMLAPLIAQWHSSQGKFEHIQNDAVRSYNNNGYGVQTPFKYHLHATVQPYSGGEMFVADQIATQAITLSHPASSSNLSAEIWAYYSCNFMLGWPNVTWGNFSIGSDLIDGTPVCQQKGCTNAQPPVYCSNGDMVNWGGNSSSAGLPPSSGNSFFWKQVNFGTHNPNFQYNFRIEKLNSPMDFDAWVWIDMQVIFRGYFDY